MLDVLGVVVVYIPTTATDIITPATIIITQMVVLVVLLESELDTANHRQTAVLVQVRRPETVALAVMAAVLAWQVQTVLQVQTETIQTVAQVPQVERLGEL